jgi:hypothetical protein
MPVRDYTFRGLTKSLCPHCRRTLYPWAAVVLVVGPAAQWWYEERAGGVV